MSVVTATTPVPVRRGSAVRVAGLTQRYGSGPVVLDDVSLEVADGELVCLLGASGCGKSTLLQVLAGLETPTAGTVEVAGGRPALMFQDAALLPWLTAAQNVELALRLRGVRAADRRREARELLALVRLADAGDKRVHELSGGMRQRVAVARALAQDSRVLLMDEPFGALDAITRDVLHSELTRLRRERALTVLFVTHDVREAVHIGDRVLLLGSRPGRVVRSYAADGLAPASETELVGRVTDDLRAEIRRHADAR